MTPLEALYLSHRGALLRQAHALGCGTQDAEDLVQDTFITAQRHLSAFDGIAPRAWLGKILHNHVRNWRSKQGRRLDMAVGLDPCAWDISRPRVRPGAVATPPLDVARFPSPEDAAIAEDAVDRCLECLTPAQKATVALVDLWGFSISQAAHVLGIKESAVKMRHSRARRALKTCLEEDKA